MSLQFLQCVLNLVNHQMMSSSLDVIHLLVVLIINTFFLILYLIDDCTVIDLIYLLTLGGIIICNSFSVSLPFAPILLLVLFLEL